VGARKPLRLIDLFAGAGGMTRGFVSEGYIPVKAVEADLHAAATYASNFGEDHTYWGKIEDFRDVPEADVVVGGPPCQGFSNLGKRDDLDDRNELFREFVRVAGAANADVFVFENVDRFRRTPHLRWLEVAASKEGFVTQTYTLNAADFGVPQRRVRTIVIGSRVGPVPDPVETHARLGAVDGRPSWMTLSDAIRSLAFDPSASSPPKRVTTHFGQEVPGAFSLSEIHFRRSYQEISLERYDRIAPGRNRFDLPDHLLYECWRRHKTGSGDVLGRLEWDKPAVTIRTEFFKPEKGRYLHPEWNKRGRRVNRALTHAEAARLQGFDDSHTWCGSKIEIARQIGNAVPPPLAAAVARAVREHLVSLRRRAA
jgi:DNA (cytosine-5)-methyltransferase 1